MGNIESLHQLEVWGGMCPGEISGNEPNSFQWDGVHPKRDEKRILIIIHLPKPNYFDVLRYGIMWHSVTSI